MVKKKIADVDECMVDGVWRPDYVDFLLLSSIYEDSGKRVSIKEIINELDRCECKLSPAVCELGKILGSIDRWDSSTRSFDTSSDFPSYKYVDFYLAMKLAEEVCVSVTDVIKDLHDYGVPLSFAVKELARRCKIFD